MKPFVPDIDVANAFLGAAVEMCIFARNGLCWGKCPVQGYCLPLENGLLVVADLKEAI